MSTRYLSASAILLGDEFRNQCIELSEERHRARAPELGIDFALIAALCRTFKTKEGTALKQYAIVSAICLLGGLLGAFFQPENALLIFLAAGVLCAGSLAGLLLKKQREDEGQARAFFGKDNFDSERVVEKLLLPEDRERYLIEKRGIQNVIVYRGFSPFVGAGVSVGGWTLVTDISKPRHLFEKSKVQAVAITDLYSEVGSALEGMEMPGMEAVDAIFVHGSQIRDKKWILPGPYSPPLRGIEGASVLRYQESNDTTMRHYRWFRIVDWSEDLIISYFLRFSLRGKNLCVEYRPYVLTPLGDKFRKVDKLLPRDFWEDATAFFVWMLASPFAASGSIREIFNRVFEALHNPEKAKEDAVRKEIDRDPFFNYGAADSLRGSCASGIHEHYFQAIDKEVYLRAIESQILDSVIKYLDERNIDTSSLKERESTILNNGVLVQGGDVNANALAVGNKAKTSVMQKVAAVKESVGAT